MIDLGGTEALLLEVKPSMRLVELENLHKYEVGKTFAMENGMSFLVTNDRGQTINFFKKRPINSNFESYILSQMSKYKSLNYGEVKWAAIEWQANSFDIISIALQHDFAIIRKPWRLIRRLK